MMIPLEIKKDKKLLEEFIKNEFIIHELTKIKNNFKILNDSTFKKDFDYFLINFKSTLFRTFTYRTEFKSISTE